MKIARIETFLVAPRWLFCRIETDTGIVGWGEPVVEGRAATVRTAVHELEPLLIGANPLHIEDLWQQMSRGTFYRGGAILASAVAGIDQALWDIAGKYRDAPVHELLGGPVRDRVRGYAWVGGDDPSLIAEQIAEKMESGYTAIKMNAVGPGTTLRRPGDLAGIVERAQLARELLGDQRDFAMDFHGRMSLTDSRRVLPDLAPLRPMFIEEPVTPEHTHQLAELTRIGVPISTGERLFSRAEFLPVFQAGVAVAQPDISHAGGITEIRKIASMAEVWGTMIAPHCPLGPIALASSLQLGFALPNFLIQELSLGIHYNQGADVLDYLENPEVFRLDEGHISRFTGPGLGIVINEAAVRDADRRGHSWSSPMWRDDQGAVAEW